MAMAMKVQAGLQPSSAMSRVGRFSGLEGYGASSEVYGASRVYGAFSGVYGASSVCGASSAAAAVFPALQFSASSSSLFSSSSSRVRLQPSFGVSSPELADGKLFLFTSRRHGTCEASAAAATAAGASGASAGAAPATVTRPWKTADCRLVLEDGSVWRGTSFGATGTQVGEVVFNTSLTGYQEILTDPSYAGQFVLMTQPHIGNTGINREDEESSESRCFLGGLLVRSVSRTVSNWRSTEDLAAYLKARNVMGISDVDTRAITRRLREVGSLVGVLTTDDSLSDQEILSMARTWNIVGKDLISDVSCRQPYEWKEKTFHNWEFSSTVVPPSPSPPSLPSSSPSSPSLPSLSLSSSSSSSSASGHDAASELHLGSGSSSQQEFHVVVYDFGVKQNILRRLSSYGCKLTVVPSSWPAAEVMKLKPDGILFSNGPGDPSAVPYAVESVEALVGKVPVFGICMGHQLLGQALGGRTFKMKFGHHGGNHPVRHLPTGRVEISAQNHNYAVDPATLPEGVEVTHVNLNDGSCAGLTFPAMKAMSIQYHPEASPGPHDADPNFYDFIKMMQCNKNRSHSSSTGVTDGDDVAQQHSA